MRRQWSIGLVGGLAACLWITDSQLAVAALYRCMTDTEGTIYTDTPAQLERCTAMAPAEPLGNVTAAPAPAASPMTMAPTGEPPAAIVPEPPNAAPIPEPCPTGLNPLNPFSAPPCPASDSIQTTPAVSPVPAPSPAMP